MFQLLGLKAREKTRTEYCKRDDSVIPKAENG